MQMVRDISKAVEYLLEQKKSAEEWLLVLAGNPSAVLFDGFSPEDTKQYLQSQILKVDEALEGLVQPPQAPQVTVSRHDREDDRDRRGSHARERRPDRRVRRPESD